MGELFDRRAVLQMGAVEIDGLRVAFKVEKTAEPEPNDAEVSVWNLSRETRAKVTQDRVPIVLRVGYGTGISQVFAGDILRDGITTVRDGSDWVTTFKAGDGAEAYRTSRVQEAFGKGAKLADVFKKTAESMGVGMGNALTKIRQGDAKGALTEFFQGAVLSGRTPDELTRVCGSLGYGWSIQDGQLQIIEKGKWTDDEAVLLAPDSGLIGSPEPGKDGITKIRSLLQPTIKPLRRVKLETRFCNGFFVVMKVTHSGDTHGNDWFSDCEARLIP